MNDTKPALPEPDGYFYEMDGYFGIHRQFDTAPYNGMRPHRTVGYFTADTARAAIEAAVAVALAQMQERIDEQRRTIDALMAGMPEDGTLPVIKRIGVLEQQLAEARAGWKRECDDTDKLLSGLGLDPERCRTEGGSLNVGKTLTLLAEARAVPVVTDNMVSRFLCWPLPRDFYPDCGISFDGRKDDEWNKNKTWPTGTNLLTAIQARQMLAHVLTATPSAAEQPKRAVWEAPDDLRGLDTATRVRFYEHDFYVLSNFSAFSIVWGGRRFDTSEHLYHYLKFNTTAHDVADAIFGARSAHEAFKLAERNKGARRKDWDAVKVELMRDILRLKVKQHEYVRRKLLATDDRELVEDSWRDDFCGWGPNRDGQNMLGKLWMEVRAELRAALQGEPHDQA